MHGYFCIVCRVNEMLKTAGEFFTVSKWSETSRDGIKKLHVELICRTKSPEQIGYNIILGREQMD